VAYPLSYRQLEETMAERGVSVDHSSINRWAIRFLPLIEKLSRKHKCPVGGCWHIAPMSTGSRPAPFRIPITHGGKKGLILLDQI
jgi:hypothetical protein